MTAIVFGVLDALWLGVVARGLYLESFGSLLADPVNVPPAAAFYLIYTLGLTHFGTAAGLVSRSVARAAVQGGMLGLVAYATYDLTSLAVIDDFPADVVLIDIAWGTGASAAAAAAATVTVGRSSERGKHPNERRR